MRALTLEALRNGIHDPERMREHISRTLQQPNDSRLTNTHAWALVDLQASGEVLKRGYRDYVLATDASAVVNEPFSEPTEDRFPTWARKLVARANKKNSSTGPRFTQADLIAVWERSGGRCAVTGREFSVKPVSNGFVKRVYGPSLDRIRAGEPYTRENCRLVLVAVNFAMNSWGLDVYLGLARDAVRNQPA